MRGYNPKITELFDSLSVEDRKDLRWMLDCGLTLEAARELFEEGLVEEASTGCQAVDGLSPSSNSSVRRHEALEI